MDNLILVRMYEAIAGAVGDACRGFSVKTVSDLVFETGQLLFGFGNGVWNSDPKRLDTANLEHTAGKIFYGQAIGNCAVHPKHAVSGIFRESCGWAGLKPPSIISYLHGTACSAFPDMMLNGGFVKGKGRGYCVQRASSFCDTTWLDKKTISLQGSEMMLYEKSCRFVQTCHVKNLLPNQLIHQ